MPSTTRAQSQPEACNRGAGLPGHSAAAHCDYQAAPFFNVLAAFWIQFMTHDWFSHLDEGENDRSKPMRSAGCTSAEAQALGCRPGDRFEPALVEASDDGGSFTHDGQRYMKRAPKRFRNNVTAWWDASQIYGYDEISLSRVKRDPDDPARLLMRSTAAESQGYLPRFAARCG